ncbi:MAG: ATP-binding protein [Peptococcaceae bacterium]|nr:ATP-binding protein [Peptococcaceae bacterium]
MKVHLESLGVIQNADIEVGKFTILCGLNNSGKTYVTYAIYGFLYFWQNQFSINTDPEILRKLKGHGFVAMSLKEYIDSAQKIVDKACLEYTKILSNVFSAQEKLFEDSLFKIEIMDNEIEILKDEYKQGIRTSLSKSQVMMLQKGENEMDLEVTLYEDEDSTHDEEIPDYFLKHTLSNAIKEIVFCYVFPRVYIASAERTGAAIFRQELNFARNRLLDEIGGKKAKIDPIKFLFPPKSDYAWPVDHNVDFVRKLETISRKESYFSSQYKDIIESFTDILGGDYLVNKNNELTFTPAGKKIRLSMDESSSSVRSLLDIGFYIKHVAQRHDLLMIDEPELNLHPENQRKMARLLASLINCGVNIFVTTHSDYILRELSNLILLNRELPHIQNIVDKEGYKQTELLRAESIKVYTAKVDLLKLSSNTRRSLRQTLVPTMIDKESGIETSCFDDTIETMNRIQDEIMFGE